MNLEVNIYELFFRNQRKIRGKSYTRKFPQKNTQKT